MLVETVDPTGLRSDLSRLIRRQFDSHGIAYSRSASPDRLAARYLEMMLRRIQPEPRRVHFSDQTHASLRRLAQRTDEPAACAAWGTVLRLRQLLVEGRNVNGFLTRNIRHAMGGRSRDGLLWHHGMHHFHLGGGFTADGFVQRSDYLLLAIVGPQDAYFVDVRRHPPPGGIEWASQELLRIVHSNWPELIEAKTLHGVLGDELLDTQVHELRRKNVNCAVDLGGAPIAPLLGGTAGDGSSVLCTLWAGRLLADLQYHEDLLGRPEGQQAVTKALRASGLAVQPVLEFELVFLDDLGPPPELVTALSAATCISDGLCRMGLAWWNDPPDRRSCCTTPPPPDPRGWPVPKPHTSRAAAPPTVSPKSWRVAASRAATTPLHRFIQRMHPHLRCGRCMILRWAPPLLPQPPDTPSSGNPPDERSH